MAIREPDRKIAPEHRRLSRYGTMTLKEIMELPVSDIAKSTAHLYLWVPNALLPDGLAVMKAWGFTYKSNLVWHKVRKEAGRTAAASASISATSRNSSYSGYADRTRAPSLRAEPSKLVGTRKREHSRKPDEQYKIIEHCSPGPFLELFARGTRSGWKTWGIKPLMIIDLIGVLILTIRTPRPS